MISAEQARNLNRPAKALKVINDYVKESSLKGFTRQLIFHEWLRVDLTREEYINILDELKHLGYSVKVSYTEPNPNFILDWSE